MAKSRLSRKIDGMSAWVSATRCWVGRRWKFQNRDATCSKMMETFTPNPSILQLFSKRTPSNTISLTGDSRKFQFLLPVSYSFQWSFFLFCWLTKQTIPRFVRDTYSKDHTLFLQKLLPTATSLLFTKISPVFFFYRYRTANVKDCRCLLLFHQEKNTNFTRIYELHLSVVKLEREDISYKY